MDKDEILQEIEKLRKELNQLYTRESSVTPDLLALSVRLDRLLNEWHNGRTHTQTSMALKQ